MPVHPRAYGERSVKENTPLRESGSSPCIRGTGRPRWSLRIDNRFIPVHTGNGGNECQTNAPDAVHPRAYGERFLLYPQPVFQGGSSPCIRGTGRKFLARRQILRFIPVHTGNGPISSRDPSSGSIQSPSLKNGSSPCIRGTVRSSGLIIPGIRFIPVHTGNGRSSGLIIPGIPVHPRAYGERSLTKSDKASIDGSSPCIRGTAISAEPTTDRTRFIPVHTGNGTAGKAPPCAYPVHPRAYGERKKLVSPADDGDGSSPCIRGTEFPPFHGPVCQRFIPVHTGNGVFMFRTKRSVTVHPRAYGERTSVDVGEGFSFGSSPCIRGTVCKSFYFLKRIRFIPVHTGNGYNSSVRSPSVTVHPRAYGERLFVILENNSYPGSSPCIRGTD